MALLGASWVLVIVIFSGNGAAVDHISFSSKAACEKFEKGLYAGINRGRVINLPMYSACIENTD